MGGRGRCLIIKFHFSHSHCSFDRPRPRALIINRDPQVGLVWQSGSGLISSESQERRQLARPGRGQVQPRQGPRLTLKKSHFYQQVGRGQVQPRPSQWTNQVPRLTCFWRKWGPCLGTPLRCIVEDLVIGAWNINMTILQTLFCMFTFTLILQRHSQLWSYLPDTTRSPKPVTW